MFRILKAKAPQSQKCEIKFSPVYATRPNSCILSILADRDAGPVEKGVSDY